MAVTESRQADGERAVAEDRQYLIHSWSVQSALAPIQVAGGEGRYFWDYSGKRYLDFAAQLVNLALGHQHPKLVAAIKKIAASKEYVDFMGSRGFGVAYLPPDEFGRFMAKSDTDLGATMKAVGIVK